MDKKYLVTAAIALVVSLLVVALLTRGKLPGVITGVPSQAAA